MSNRIGEQLVRSGLVSNADVTKALQIQSNLGGRIGAILTRIGALSEDQFVGSLSNQLQMPILHSGKLPDPKRVIECIESCGLSLDWCLRHNVFFWNESGVIAVLSGDTFAAGLLPVLLQFFPGATLNIYLATTDTVDKLKNTVESEYQIEHYSHDMGGKELAELAQEAPIVELVNNIFSQAVDAQSSDIHIEPLQDSFVVRFRVDGVLRKQVTQPIDRFAAVSSRIKLISGIDIAERRLPQDGRTSIKVSGQEMDVRVSTVPEVNGESIVMRLLPKDRKELNLSALGMEPDHLDLITEWAAEANGIVLVTGPTGSGKSTTLYSMLEEANTGEKKIITVEDPVEYKVKGVTQIQAHAEIGYTFSKALRAILRQDPDVVMIGEIRDVETAEIAVQSALTGHLVLSTLHTNDSISAFSRLVDMGIEPFLVSAPMRGVQAQRLIRKLCQQCKQPLDISTLSELTVSQFNCLGVTTNTLYKAVGCDSCNHTGYKGRLGIYELLAVTPEIQKLVAKQAGESEIYEQASQQGFRTLYDDGLIKVSRGITTLEEVMRVVGH